MSPVLAHVRDAHGTDAAIMAILVNEGNFHYRLGRFRGAVVFDTSELRSHIDQLLASSSDED